MKMRTKWIMKHPIQTKYLLIVIMAMLVPTVLVGFCFYSLVFNLLAEQMVFPEAIMANLAPVIERVNMLPTLILPVLVFVTLSVALVISHRFAGPIERLETDLDTILSGRYDYKISMRKKDDLSGVADRINALVKQINR